MIDLKSLPWWFTPVIITIVLSFLIGFYIGPEFDNVSTNSSSNMMKSNNNFRYNNNISGRRQNMVANPPEINIYNEYTIDRPLAGNYPWDIIVEPYKVSTMEVTNPANGYTYEWYVDDWHKDDGTSISMMFLAPTGTFSKVRVDMRDELSGELLHNTEINVMVKYVRREIRSLIDQDREAFFHAVAIMQRVPTHIGKKLYGKNYRSKDFFNRIHLYYGGSKSCDHWHQGPGFVTSHITFTLMYEQSLQAINPSISLPYWDFTLESTFYEPDTFRDSGVFSEDWFGDAVCNNSDHTPIQGRFSKVPVMEDATNFSALVSPYGLLRSPWNSDPTPYMTRSSLIFNIFNNLKPSGCMEYHHALQFTDWKNLAKQLNSNAHGHIHELLGGSWNPETYLDLPTSDTGLEEAYEFAHATEAYSKILWRFGYLLCPENDSLCKPNDESSNCKCVCTEESLSNITSAHILAATGIIHSLVFYDKEGNPIENWQNKTTKVAYEELPGYTSDETQAIYDDIMRILCNPGHIGDMFQATSTNDITFWILHPTLERLWHLTRLNAKNELILFDDDWPDNEVTCHGHYSYDPTPFKNIFDNNNTVYTNAELYELLNPARDEFPYVYDHFRWSHCTFLGYDMSGISS